MFNVIQISISVCSDEALKRLNQPPPAVDNAATVVRAIAALPERGFGDEWEPYLAELGARFRQLVDEWLATGRREDGSEFPAGRNLSRAPEACRRVMRYMDRHPPRVVLSPDGSQLSVFIAEVSALPPSPNPFYDASNDGIRLFVGVITSDWDGTCPSAFTAASTFSVPVFVRSIRRGPSVVPSIKATRPQ